MIADTFDVVPGSLTNPRPANFIEFPYDWRLDNRIHARRLAALVEDRLHEWRRHSGNPQARVILVAHSMGGLIARHYLEVLEGWRSCRALITFGTPYRGSLNALNFLANGYKKLFVDLTAAMRSFPSVHQLLPIYKALRLGEDYVRVAETRNVPGVDVNLAKDALIFHPEIEDKVKAHLKPDARQPGFPIVLGVRCGLHRPLDFGLQAGLLMKADLEVRQQHLLRAAAGPSFGPRFVVVEVQEGAAEPVLAVRWRPRSERIDKGVEFRRR
jgi:pimeloyl-ACP methyl ester carboxylesterase